MGEEVDDDDDGIGEDIGEDEEDAEGETDDDDEDDATGVGVSGTSTPDLGRMTKRQRSRLGDLYAGDLLELPNSGFGMSTPLLSPFVRTQGMLIWR